MRTPEDPVVLRPATPEDRDFVAGLSALVFARFGPYETYLPDLMGERGVRTLVAVADGESVGFAMVSLESRSEADLIAIATVPAWQRRGVAGRMLQEVERRVLAVTGKATARLRLTVAEDNIPARRLFESVGYVPVPGHVGSYPAGQRSIAMRKRLRSLAPDRATM